MKQSTQPSSAPNGGNGVKKLALVGTMAASLLAACTPDFKKGHDKSVTVSSLVAQAEKSSNGRQLLESAVISAGLPRVWGAPLPVQAFDNLHEFFSETIDNGINIRDTYPNGEYVDFAITVDDTTITITYTSPAMTNKGKTAPIDGTIKFSKNEKNTEVTFTDTTGKEIPVKDVNKLRNELKAHLGVQ